MVHGERVERRPPPPPEVPKRAAAAPEESALYSRGNHGEGSTSQYQQDGTEIEHQADSIQGHSLALHVE
jgi:hypothetical protein